MALCPVCETFETECGWPACDECLNEHGEDPAKLETVAAHKANMRKLARRDNAAFHFLNSISKRVA